MCRSKVDEFTLCKLYLNIAFLVCFFWWLHLKFPGQGIPATAATYATATAVPAPFTRWADQRNLHLCIDPRCCSHVLYPLRPSRHSSTFHKTELMKYTEMLQLRCATGHLFQFTEIQLTCNFKMCNAVIWYMSVSWNDFHNSFAEHIHHLT